MRIDPTRGDWIRVARAYGHCLDHRADRRADDAGKLRWGADTARDLANEMAAQDLWDAATAAVLRRDA